MMLIWFGALTCTSAVTLVRKEKPSPTLSIFLVPCSTTKIGPGRCSHQQGDFYGKQRVLPELTQLYTAHNT